MIANEPLTPFADCILSQRMGIRVTKKSKTEFAGKLKSWRVRESVSQSVAAEILGVPVRTLQNWEIARTKPSTLTERMLMAVIEPAPRKVRKRK